MTTRIRNAITALPSCSYRSSPPDNSFGCRSGRGPVPAITDLPVAVVAPRPDVSGAVERHRVPLTGGNRDDIREAGNQDGRRPLNDRAVAQLAILIRAPRFHGA